MKTARNVRTGRGRTRSWTNHGQSGSIAVQHLESRGNARYVEACPAAAAPESGTLTEPAAFDGSDEHFLKQFFVPGIQRAGGWSAALGLAGGK
jgi:hypothetical protein